MHAPRNLGRCLGPIPAGRLPQPTGMALSSSCGAPSGSAAAATAAAAAAAAVLAGIALRRGGCRGRNWQQAWCVCLQGECSKTRQLCRLSLLASRGVEAGHGSRRRVYACRVNIPRQGSSVVYPCWRSVGWRQGMAVGVGKEGHPGPCTMAIL
eukprot:1160884-Pelagomonas_calceolata.AAC.7